MRSPVYRSSSLWLAGWLAVAIALVALAALLASFGSAQTARAVRSAFTQLRPIHILEIGTALLVIGASATVTRADPRVRRVLGRAGWTRWKPAVSRVPTPIVLVAAASVAAVFRISLGMATTTPSVLGDELIYSGLAKSWALHGQPLLRGSVDVGDSLLYPLFLAPAYRLASTGTAAFAAAKVMNAIVVSLAAVPSYLLARRVVSRGWSLGVAALTVAVPWTAYSSLVMTESLFYPVFVAFALVLAWTLERPTTWRQLLLVAGLALLCAIRAQALAVAGGVLVAIALAGLLEDSLRGTPRRYAPTLGVMGAAVVAALGASAAGLSVPTGSYHSVFDAVVHVVGIAKWAAWNLGAYELSLGVIAMAAFPLALGGLLRRSTSKAERSVGIAAASLFAAIVASVALLSASPYGLGILHERNLFYVMPLVVVCVAHWLSHGMSRPRRLTAVVAIAAVALPALLPQRLVLDRVNSVDGPTMSFFRRLVEDSPGVSLRVWLLAIPVVAVGTLLLARRPLFPALSLVLAFVAVTAANDYRGPFTPAQDRALAWVDSALPAGEATVVHIGYSGPPGSCAYIAEQEQQRLAVWTEFFNTRVAAVAHIFDDVHPAGLASPKLGFGAGGLVVERGVPFRPGYVVIDSRQPIVGTRLARLDLRSLGSQFQSGASMTLWKVDPPLRFYPHAEPLPARPDGGTC